VRVPRHRVRKGLLQLVDSHVMAGPNLQSEWEILGEVPMNVWPNQSTR
jgi:hypothetical protein